MLVGIRGSSPLTRGKPGAGAEALTLAGLIPAHAGKTLVAHWARLSAGAHPRSRGENYIDNANPLMGLGSSPLTRGKRHDGVQGRPRNRLIPAHAGKTVRARTSPAPKRAHPRSRGEN